MSRLEVAIAWRYLRSRRGSKLLSLISVIAIGGVVIGVSALIVIMGVMSGLQNDLREKILIGSPDVRVLNYGSDMVLKDWKPVLEKVSRQPGVVAAAPFVLTKALVNAGHKYSDGAFVMGIIPEGQGGPPVTTIRSFRTAGDFRFQTTDGKQRGAVLGAKLANRLGVYPGADSITLTTAGTAISPVTGMPIPREVHLEVTGVFDTGMYEYDLKFVYVTNDSLQAFLDRGDTVDGIEIRIPSPDDTDEYVKTISDKLGPNYRVQDWKELNRSLFSALKLEKIAMFLVLGIVILVASFSIVGNLIMVVVEKQREIALLKTLGASDPGIMQLFAIQGLLIGLIGTLLGVATGLAACYVGKRIGIPLNPDVYYIDQMPVNVDPQSVALTFGAGVIISILATFYPALLGARVRPATGMRH